MPRDLGTALPNAVFPFSKNVRLQASITVACKAFAFSTFCHAISQVGRLAYALQEVEKVLRSLARDGYGCRQFPVLGKGEKLLTTRTPHPSLAGLRVGLGPGACQALCHVLA